MLRVGLLCWAVFLMGCLEASVRRHSEVSGPSGQLVQKASVVEVAHNPVAGEAVAGEDGPRLEAVGSSAGEPGAVADRETTGLSATGSGAVASEQSAENLTNRQRAERAVKSAWDKISTSATGVAKKIKSSFTEGEPDETASGEFKVNKNKFNEAALDEARPVSSAGDRGVQQPDDQQRGDHQWRQLLGRVERLEQRLGPLLLQVQQHTLNQNKNIDEDDKLLTLQQAMLELEQRLQNLENHASSTDADIDIDKNNDKDKKAEIKSALPQARPKVGSKKTKKRSSQKVGNFAGAQQAFSGERWREAIQGYKKYRQLNPRGKQYAVATYKMGVSFENLGLKKEARSFYQELISKYPRSRLTSKVKFRLSRL